MSIRRFIHIADGLEDVLLVTGPGEVYQIWSNMVVAGLAKIYFNDATAEGVDGRELHTIRQLPIGPIGIAFDPPLRFEKGLSVNLTATAQAGDTYISYSARTFSHRSNA